MMMMIVIIIVIIVIEICLSAGRIDNRIPNKCNAIPTETLKFIGAISVRVFNGVRQALVSMVIIRNVPRKAELLNYVHH